MSTPLISSISFPQSPSTELGKRIISDEYLSLDPEDNDAIVTNLGKTMESWRDEIVESRSTATDESFSVTDSIPDNFEKYKVTKVKAQNVKNNRNSCGDSKSKKLSLVSWNIWFDNFECKLRYDYILQYIRNHKPDVVCLQEVTNKFINQLRIDYSDILSEYCFSDSNVDSATVIPYGVATLCKRELFPTFSFEYFPTKMYRKLLVTEFMIGKVPFKIGTVHLESLNNQATREQQLKVCSKRFEDVEDNTFSIICGDFNFCSYRNFDMPSSQSILRTLRLDNACLSEILPDFLDLWPELHDVTVDK